MNANAARSTARTAPATGGWAVGTSADPLDAGPVQGAELSPAQFERVSRLLQRICGIRLQAGKEQLVKARLWKRLRTLGFDGYEPYLALVEGPRGEAELSTMVDALTTNKTSFFREAQHFDLLRARIAGGRPSSGGLRIWSAGCSFGQEPYTLALVLLEALGQGALRDARILATDISSRALEKARAGVYDAEEVAPVPPDLVRRYFVRESAGGQDLWKVGPAVRSMVQFARLNLMNPWPMKGPFDHVFCRNVMIYFDRETQEALVRRFWEILRPGGCLFVGHSESLTGRSGGLRYVQPAVYER